MGYQSISGSETLVKMYPQDIFESDDTENSSFEYEHPVFVGKNVHLGLRHLALHCGRAAIAIGLDKRIGLL